MILLCGGAFFSDCHLTLHGEELRIHHPATQGVREKSGMEVVEAGQRGLHAAAGETATVVRLLGRRWLDGGLVGTAGLYIMPGELAKSPI